MFNLLFSNDEAKEFYLSHNFEQVGMLENYYKRIDPPHCYIFRKVIDRENKETK